jgi:hypothetical protein
MSTTADNSIQHGPHRLLCVVPQEPDRGTLTRMANDPLLLAASVEAEMREQYANVIAFRPPLPDDIEAALELGKALVENAEKNNFYLASGHQAVQIARALLRVCGREE